MVCYRLTHIRLIELIETIEKGDIEAVKQHLAAGADVNAGGGLDDNGEPLLWTPLHLAAMGGHKEIVELLIGAGADVNAKVVSGAAQGKTPLDAANETNNKETADLLRKHGGKTGEELKAEGK
ncbi:MAG: ankyrin repeat domain-containing protein [Gammaproteobacteria bacterium]|nr:ankyrin repeat domain-containing protein [Gammaproteobacteria bacterium]